MATLNKADSQMADKSGDPLLGDRQTNVADAAVTLATLTAVKPNGLDVTYTADDPTNTPDGLITIADGDATLVTAEMMVFLDEAEANFNLMETLAVELIADHAVTLTDLTTMATKINAILDILEEHGLMTAS